jgi:signal transduction histidine kinase
MREWLRGKRSWLAGFLLVAVLVVGGLGWVTAAALRMEREQRTAHAETERNKRLARAEAERNKRAEQAAVERTKRIERAEADRNNRIRLALWRLDGYVAPFLVREDSRPFNHYAALYAVPVAFTPNRASWAPGAVMEPSPLLSTDLQPWMLLHFQTAVTPDGEMSETSWESPQVLPWTTRNPFTLNFNAYEPAGDSPAGTINLRRMLRENRVPLSNVTADRAAWLEHLAAALPPSRLHGTARDHAGPATLRDTTLLAVNRRRDQQQDNQNQPNQPPGPQQQFNQQQQQPFNQQPGQLGGQGGQGGQQAAYQNQSNDYDRRQYYINPQLNEDNRNQRQLRSVALGNTVGGNGRHWFPPDGNPKKFVPGIEADISLTPMAAFWIDGVDGQPRLLLARIVRIESGLTVREVCQGVLLDAEALRKELTEMVQDLLPGATLTPVRNAGPAEAERCMVTLPFRLDPGNALPIEPESPEADSAESAEAEPAEAEPFWTPLHVGLTLSWTAALVALLAVGLGGWTLIDLSERRIRFVSAVTHELRTPLTTLRLYLDMLMNGLVRDEKTRDEYIRTLHAEADRLTRLVGNVLDYSRLENQRPHLSWSATPVAGLLGQARDAWQTRCHDVEKELILDNGLPPETAVWTDGGLVLQVLGNLIDNACKYSRDAADRRLWLRARREDRRLIFEVEDRGPGVPAGERRAIFRSFRRGRTADVTAGGVGLGLALARRWAKLLGGDLVLMPTPAEGGACFRLTLPERTPPGGAAPVPSAADVVSQGKSVAFGTTSDHMLG